MILYHASTLCIVKPDVLHSRDKLDFGKGFYLTAFLEQAVRYAERFTQRGKDEEALGRLRYEKPNHQLCILNGLMIDRHLHFIDAKKV